MQEIADESIKTEGQAVGTEWPEDRSSEKSQPQEAGTEEQSNNRDRNRKMEA